MIVRQNYARNTAVFLAQALWGRAMVSRRRAIDDTVDRHLRAAPEWCALDEVDLNKVEKNAICKEFETGVIIFNESEVCQGVYFVTSGLVGVRKSGLDGESTLLKLAYPNDTLGYRPLIAKEPHRATAEVLKPGIICFISASIVLPLIRENPTLGLNFLHRATRELGEAEERFHKTVTLTLRARFAHLLMLWKDRGGRVDDGGKFILELPVSRGDLAAMLGVRRESVSRVINELEREGVTHFCDRHVEVNDAENLMDEFRV